MTVGLDFATGKPKRVSRYADTQEEAVKLLHEMSVMRDTSPNSFTSITLGEWLDMCLEVYMKNSLKQSTYVSYEGYIRIHLKPVLGGLQLKEITPRLLQEFYNYKVSTEGLSPKTVVNINLFLHKALSFAVNEGYIPSNPASGLNLPQGQKPQIEILTRDEQAQLMRATYHHRYGVFIRLVLFTGMRIGELLGLRWEDVDTQAGMLHVRRTLNRLKKKNRPTAPGELKTEIVIQTPKSQNSIRSIPLLPNVVQDLINWKAMQRSDQQAAGESYIDSGMIVTNPLGGYMEPRTFKDAYDQILALAGLRHFTFHALRHTFASRAIEQGMDPKTVSVLLGHASVSFTMDTYTHVLNEQKVESMALMEELFNVGQTAVHEETAYPAIAMPLANGFAFTAPDFPAIQFECPDIYQGLQDMKERLQEELLVNPCPPEPTLASAIPLQPGQLVLQIPV